MEKKLTVEVENESIDVGEIVERHGATVVLKIDDEPIQATVGPVVDVEKA